MTLKREITPQDILDVLNTHYAESIFITDGEGNIIYVNQLAAERLGSQREYLIGKNVRELVKSGLYQRSTVLMAIETKKPCAASLDERKGNVSHSVPVLDEDGDVIMVVTDNMSTERYKEWEQLLSQQMKETERLRRELDHLRLQDHSTLIAESPAMRNVMSLINTVAPTDSNVIILGESGTGKDMMARLIHQRSHRQANAFISINCAAIPDQLLESELFGYEGGAFTGALSKGKIGLFEAASGGTVFLDEIGDMPLSLQSKLLRALENHEIRRVGGVKNIPIDVRIICATNANLHDMVEAKTFREDLYYRLSVFLITLPPLRERKEDIIPLAENFLSALNERYNEKKILSSTTVETMLRHRWPGNIRELRNVVERIFVVSEGDELEFSPAPQAALPDGQPSAVQPVDPSAYGSLKAYIRAVEQQYIRSTLDACGGSVMQAAKRLGIHRSVLYRKLQQADGADRTDT